MLPSDNSSMKQDRYLNLLDTHLLGIPWAANIAVEYIWESFVWDFETCISESADQGRNLIYLSPSVDGLGGVCQLPGLQSPVLSHLILIFVKYHGHKNKTELQWWWLQWNPRQWNHLTRVIIFPRYNWI